VIGLNRPDKRSAFNLAMLADLSRAYGLLESDDDLRAGVLIAHGEHFTAGLDLLDVVPTIAAGGDSAGVFQRDQRGGQLEELVGTQIADRLDVERLRQDLGMLVGQTGQRRGRRIEDVLERLVFKCLVERLLQINRDGHDPSQNLLTTYGRREAINERCGLPGNENP